MGLRRIFSSQPLTAGTSMRLDAAAAAHVLRVLRLRRGDALVVFDGSGAEFEAAIEGIAHEEVIVRIGAARLLATESPLAITLLQGVCRGPRMDIVIQKATELGVARIEPVLAARSVVRIGDEHAARKQEHWQRVAIAAAEQSGRGRIPVVGAPQPLEQGVVAADPAGTRLMLDPAGGALGSITPLRAPLALLVGPEGGLTGDEQRLATAHGFMAVRLGPRILRTETAPLAALAVLQFLAGDLAS